MSPRTQIVADLAKHLAEEISALNLRHMLQMQAAGLSTPEATAACLSACESYAFKALGMVAMNARTGSRIDALETAIVRMTTHLREFAPDILAQVEACEAEARR